MPNNFAGDPNCVALWRMENGALTTDSKGTNTLTNVNVAVANLADFKEGVACVSLDSGTGNCLMIADASLNAGFPLKSGDLTKKISVCLWTKFVHVENNGYAFHKGDANINTRSLTINAEGSLWDAWIGYNSGIDWESLYSGGTPANGIWYHLGFTYDDTDKSWKFVVWDDTAGAKVVDASGTATNNIVATTQALVIGGLNNGLGIYDGLIDEVVVFKDILSSAEIDSIRAGTFPSGGTTALTFTGSDDLNLWSDSNSGQSQYGYTFETWAQLKTQLSNRLHDPSKIFWTDTELTNILTETLRTFSFLTWHWREQSSFNTVAATTFYDITTELSAQLDRVVTDRNLINSIEYSFQEIATTNWPGGWTGTAMFTMDDLAHTLQKRRNKFLAETGVLVTRTVASTGVPSSGRITLADSVIDVRRLARVNTGVITNLWRVDENELTAFDNSWSAPAAQNPSTYSVLSSPPITVQLAPAPTAAATMDLLTISTGADFTPITAATIVGVPDDMTWIVKWGAMADLLQKDGPAQDPERAAYCEQRYQHGVQLARLAAVIVSAKIGATPLLMCPLADLDAYQIGWQSATPATPSVLATAGLNYIAFSAPPSGATTITLDVIKNAPIPVNDSDFVQIGREMISTILDYAEHLAMFKVGGDEWKVTEQLFTQFMSMCSNYNMRMNAASKIWNEMRNVTNAEEPTRLRLRKLDAKP